MAAVRPRVLNRVSGCPSYACFLERGLAAFAAHGIEPRRLMSDNAWTYTHNRALAGTARPPTAFVIS